MSDTEWAETQYTYGDVTAGSATYKGALTQQKSLISGTSESGTWATTDIGGYTASGQAGTTTIQGVKLEDGGQRRVSRPPRPSMPSVTFTPRPIPPT